MSGISGWIGPQQEPQQNKQLAERMLKAFESPHNITRQVIQRDSGVLAASSITENIHSFITDNCLAIAYGRNYKNYDANIAQHVCKRFDGDNFNLLSEFDGPFVLAYIHPQKQQALLAIDRMATYPLCYSQQGDELIFSSSARAIHLHPNVRTEVDAQAIYNYIYFHVIPGPGTVYQNIKRLLPGQYLYYKNGTVKTGYYWQAAFSEPDSANFNNLADEFNSLLADSTKATTQQTAAGTFLSGGTDSSSVTGYAQQATDYDIPSYSIGFDAEGFDESYYSRIAAKAYKTDHHEYYLKPQQITDYIPLVAARYDQPFGNSSAVPALGCANLARECGTQRMLAGDGGDELFGGNERYAKQRIFALYDVIPSAIRKPFINPLADILPASKLLLPLRKIKRYIEQARLPMPDRMEGHNLLDYFGADVLFNADFLAEINRDNPKELLREMYGNANGNNILNSMLGLDFKITLADNDLPKVTEMCDLAGVEVAFPMLSNDIVDLSCRLPAQFKLKGSNLRPFFKQALNRILPQEIIEKKKHGFGLPFGMWALKDSGLNQLVFDSLHSLKKRHIINATFIDTLANKHMPEHPNYFGVLVWILVMLEQWYQTTE